MECLFCEFISKKRKFHESSLKGKYPLIPVYENKSVFAFLSHPDNNHETHLLIIPKNHYKFIEDIPKKELCELISIAAKISRIIRKKYSGCKIIQNNGVDAGQYEDHVHFHLVPMKKNKVVWLNLSIAKFKSLSGTIKKEISK